MVETVVHCIADWRPLVFKNGPGAYISKEGLLLSGIPDGEVVAREIPLASTRRPQTFGVVARVPGDWAAATGLRLGDPIDVKVNLENPDEVASVPGQPVPWALDMMALPEPEVPFLSPKRMVVSPYEWLRLSSVIERLRGFGDPEIIRQATDIARWVDRWAPIGKGTGGVLFSPPKVGKTTTLRAFWQLFNAFQDLVVIVMPIGERPAEVNSFSSLGKGIVAFSSFDDPEVEQVAKAEAAFAYARWLVGQGKHVVVLLDSLTSYAQALNVVIEPSGRALTGGLDLLAPGIAKKCIGLARAFEDRSQGSLTVLSAVVIGQADGTRRSDAAKDLMGDEFTRTGTTDLELDPNIPKKHGVWPAFSLFGRFVPEPGTRNFFLMKRPEPLDQDALLGVLGRDGCDVLLAELAGHPGSPEVQVRDAILSVLGGSQAREQILGHMSTVRRMGLIGRIEPSAARLFLIERMGGNDLGQLATAFSEASKSKTWSQLIALLKEEEEKKKLQALVQTRKPVEGEVPPADWLGLLLNDPAARREFLTIAGQDQTNLLWCLFAAAESRFGPVDPSWLYRLQAVAFTRTRALGEAEATRLSNREPSDAAYYAEVIVRATEKAQAAEKAKETGDGGSSRQDHRPTQGGRRGFGPDHPSAPVQTSGQRNGGRR